MYPLLLETRLRDFTGPQDENHFYRSEDGIIIPTYVFHSVFVVYGIYTDGPVHICVCKA